MKSRGRVEIDIGASSQSVTATVNRVLGDDKHIAPQDVKILDNGWLRLKRGKKSLYISPHAVESVLVEEEASSKAK